MTEEFSASSPLSPPVVPLHKLRETPPEPVAPPFLPGRASTTAPILDQGPVLATPRGTSSTALATPAQPKDYPPPKVPIGKKKERRRELVGLEPGDPLSTYHLIKRGFKNVLSIVPKLTKKYWWLIIVVLGLWFFLANFSVYSYSAKAPALTPLWMFLDKFILVLVFLTASYNNFVAKGVYAAVIIRVGVPLVRRVRRDGPKKVSADFRVVVPGFKRSWAEAGTVALSLLIGFIGVGAFLSNYLTRNNRIDKIAVSLALAMALIKALSDGPKSLPFMAGRVVMKDLFAMLLRPSPVRNQHIYLAVSGLAIGLLCSLPLAFLSKMTSDYIGYIIGIIAVIVAGVFFLLKAKPIGKAPVEGKVLLKEATAEGKYPEDEKDSVDEQAPGARQ